MEACRIGIVFRAPGVVDVGAPMKHKPLCYEILKDARTVIERTGDEHFKDDVRVLTIVMDMTGRVDVGAPLPNRWLAYRMLADAKDVIERYDDAQAPVLKAFHTGVLGQSP